MRNGNWTRWLYFCACLFALWCIVYSTTSDNRAWLVVGYALMGANYLYLAWTSPTDATRRWSFLIFGLSWLLFASNVSWMVCVGVFCVAIAAVLLLKSMRASNQI